MIHESLPVPASLPYCQPSPGEYPTASPSFNFRTSLTRLRSAVEANIGKTARPQSGKRLRGNDGQHEHLPCQSDDAPGDRGKKRGLVEASRGPSDHSSSDSDSLRASPTSSVRLLPPLCFCHIPGIAVCVYDRYPKARRHLLMMPTTDSSLGDVVGLNDLRPRRHLEGLRTFHSVARVVAEKVEATLLPPTPCPTGGERGLRPPRVILGYHAVPSLETLHLHIISSDFDSPCIKNRKHIQSFTSSFFVYPEVLERHIEGGSLGDHLQVRVRRKRAEELLKLPLACFRCGRRSINVPQWKRHNAECCDSSFGGDGDRGGDRNGGLDSPATGTTSASLLGWSSDGGGTLDGWVKRKDGG